MALLPVLAHICGLSRATCKGTMALYGKKRYSSKCRRNPSLVLGYFANAAASTTIEGDVSVESSCGKIESVAVMVAPQKWWATSCGARRQTK